jgi:hypothetical protein
MLILKSEFFFLLLFLILAPGLKLKAENGISVNISDKVMDHILNGDVNDRGQLTGGLHTIHGLVNFIKRHPGRHFFPNEKKDLTQLLEENMGALNTRHIERIKNHFMGKIIPNGVAYISIPDDLLNKGSREALMGVAKNNTGAANTKLMFPEQWDREKIKQAIKSVVRTHASNITTRMTIEGQFEGVNITVWVDQFLEVHTAYPSLNQPQAGFDIHLPKNLLNRSIKEVIKQEAANINLELLYASESTNPSRDGSILTRLFDAWGSYTFLKFILGIPLEIKRGYSQTELARLSLETFGIKRYSAEEIFIVENIIANPLQLNLGSLKERFNTLAKKELLRSYKPASMNSCDLLLFSNEEVLIHHSHNVYFLQNFNYFELFRLSSAK